MLILERERGFKKTYLYEEDIAVLKHLLLHQAMKTRNIIDYYLSISDRSEKGVSNRLSNLWNAGILRRHQVNISVYYYRVGVRGVRALVQLGHMTEDEAKYYDKLITNKKKLSHHDEAVSILANKTFIHCERSGYLDMIEQSPGYTHRLFGDNKLLSLEERNVVVPDWVFSKEDKHICLEVDTGTQRGSKINVKVNRYIKRAKQMLPQNQNLIVVFSVVDDTVDSDYTENRERRIASLKSTLPLFADLPENLIIYVETAKELPPLVERLLIVENFKSNDEQQEENYYFANRWLKMATQEFTKTHDVKLVEKDAVFLPRRNKKLDVELLFSLKDKRRGGGTNYYAVIYGDPASIKTNQIIRTTGARIKEVNELGLHPKIHVIVVYKEREYAVNDVFGEQLSCDLWKTDTRTWVRTTKEAPKMMKYISPFMKEWRYFIE